MLDGSTAEGFLWEGENRVRYLGVVRDILLLDRTMLDIEMRDIEWVEASWHVSKEDEAIWNNSRTYEELASEDYLTRPVVYARDPFHVGRDYQWESDSFICINGVGTTEENVDGWRRFTIWAPSPGVAQGAPMEYLFDMVLDGQKFNLPSAGGPYFIDPVNNTYKVHWR